jgi:hypothetical protein
MPRRLGPTYGATVTVIEITAVMEWRLNLGINCHNLVQKINATASSICVNLSYLERTEQ